MDNIEDLTIYLFTIIVRTRYVSTLISYIFCDSILYSILFDVKCDYYVKLNSLFKILFKVKAFPKKNYLKIFLAIHV